MTDLPGKLRKPENHAALAFLRGKSAHGDIVEDLIADSRKVATAEIHCHEPRNFGYLCIHEGRIVTFAEGMQGATLRLPSEAADEAIVRGRRTAACSVRAGWWCCFARRDRIFVTGLQNCCASPVCNGMFAGLSNHGVDAAWRSL